MLKKMGMVGIGITAGLLAAAPLASATECPPEHTPSHGHSGHGGGHDNFNSTCNFKGGNANSVANIPGDAGLAGNVVAQAPVAGNNIGNIADCSSFLNDNLNGNLSGNNLALLGSNLLPG